MNNFAVMSIISNYCLQAFFIILKTFLIYKIYKEVKKNTRKDKQVWNICKELYYLADYFIYYLIFVHRLFKYIFYTKYIDQLKKIDF